MKRFQDTTNPGTKRAKILENATFTGMDINPEHFYTAFESECLRQEGRFDEALNELNRIIILNKNNDFALAIRGRLFKDLRLFEKASSDLSHALKINPKNYFASICLTQILHSSQNLPSSSMNNLLVIGAQFLDASKWLFKKSNFLQGWAYLFIALHLAPNNQEALAMKLNLFSTTAVKNKIPNASPKTTATQASNQTLESLTRIDNEINQQLKTNPHHIQSLVVAPQLNSTKLTMSVPAMENQNGSKNLGQLGTAQKSEPQNNHVFFKSSLNPSPALDINKNQILSNSTKLKKTSILTPRPKCSDPVMENQMDLQNLVTHEKVEHLDPLFEEYPSELEELYNQFMGA